MTQLNNHSKKQFPSRFSSNIEFRNNMNLIPNLISQQHSKKNEFMDYLQTPEKQQKLKMSLHSYEYQKSLMNHSNG